MSTNDPSDTRPKGDYSFPYKMSLFFNKQLARRMKDKHVYVGFAYLNKKGKVYKKKTFHGTLLAADSKKGLEIWEAGTAKLKYLPPDLRAWKRAKKGSYKDKLTGEIIENVDYVSTWLVESGHLLSPIVANETLKHRRSRHYSVYGFGTKMVGRANKQDNGSFTSTKWITLFFFPVIPVGTFRIYNVRRSTMFDTGSSARHESDPLFMDKWQVALTYAIWLPLLTAFIAAIIHSWLTRQGMTAI